MLKQKIASLLQKSLRTHSRGYSHSFASTVEVFIPENEKFGHYSTNAALKLAKLQGANPLLIAEKLSASINGSALKGFFEKIEIAPPGFINFWLSQETIFDELKNVLRLKDAYGSSHAGKGKTIVIDFSAPNIAKPMNVGHLRSTLIGQSLVHIFRSQGYNVIGDNHLGDWGTQFGALITAYKKWGKKAEMNKNPIEYLVRLYIKFHKESEKNEELIVLAREETKKLQQGDSENKKLWKLFTKESMAHFKKIYKRLDITFDAELGESFYQPMLSSIIEEALKKGVAKLDDDAVKIKYDESLKLPDLVIQKSDGSSLYSTTDLATIKYRKEKWYPEKILYVVANEQTLHFEQLFEAAERLGYEKKENLVHVKFGMVLGASGKKMSTRRGQFIKLEKLLDGARKKAGKINKKIAEEVGIGGIKYRSLSQERKSDVVFNWDEMLNLKGKSGPYLQYTYARLKSILRKAGSAPKKPDFMLLKTESEKSVMRQLLYFTDALERAAERYETNIIADYLFKLANALNYFYEKEPILKASKPLRENRLNLIQAATIVLKNGLKILGIK